GVARDRPRRVELDGVRRPGAQARGGGVEVETFPGGDGVEREAQLAGGVEPLRAVRPERERAAEGGALEELARRGPGRPLVPAPPQLADERLRGAGAEHAGVRRRRLGGALARQVVEVEREERRPEERRLRHAVVAVGEGAQRQHELTARRSSSGKSSGSWVVAVTSTATSPYPARRLAPVVGSTIVRPGPSTSQRS